MSRNPTDDNTALWSATLNAFASRQAGLAILSGCTVSKGTGDFDSDVSSGTVWLNGARVSVSSATLTHTDTSNMSSGETRVDLISADSNGAVSITKGTAAMDPAAPGIPTDEVLLGYWQIAGDDASLASSDLFDIPDLAISVEDLTSAGSDGDMPVVQSDGSLEMRQAKLPALSDIDSSSSDAAINRLDRVLSDDSWGSIGFGRGDTGTSDEHLGSILLPDGRVLFPHDANSTGVNMLIFDPSDNSTTSGPNSGEGANPFGGGALLEDGRVALAPDESDNVGLFDPSDDSYTSGPAHGEGDFAFHGAVLAPDGRAILVPANSGNVGIFDPSDDSYSSVNHTEGTSVEFNGGVLLADGRVVFAPQTSDNVGIFDPSDDSYTSGPGHGETEPAFKGGGALLPDGRVVFSPWDSDNVGIFDPSDDSYTSGPAHGEGDSAFYGTSALPDGRVVFAPNNSSNVGIFDPSDDSYTSGPDTQATDGDFRGAATLPDGRVVFTPGGTRNDYGLVYSHGQLPNPTRNCTHPFIQGF
jgi:streptogramin lyase